MRISYILPAYNVEKYISEALHSIYLQGLEENDFEVIVINDGSKDGTLAEISHINKSNLTVISIDNHGVSYARNLGLSKALGNYVFFMDADDCLQPYTIPMCLEELERHQWKVLYIGSDRKIPDINTNKFPKHVIPVRGPVPRETKTCGCIVERKFLLDNNIYFPVGLKLGEDISWSFHIWACMVIDENNNKSEKHLIKSPILAGAIKNVVYHWRINPKSVTQTEYSNFQQLLKNRLMWIDVMLELDRKFTGESISTFIHKNVLDRINNIVNNLLYEEVKCKVSYKEHLNLINLLHKQGITPHHLMVHKNNLKAFVYEFVCNSMQFRPLAYCILLLSRMRILK